MKKGREGRDVSQPLAELDKAERLISSPEFKSRIQGGAIMLKLRADFPNPRQ
jgi:hypothetical protein